MTTTTIGVLVFRRKFRAHFVWFSWWRLRVLFCMFIFVLVFFSLHYLSHVCLSFSFLFEHLSVFCLNISFCLSVWFTDCLSSCTLFQYFPFFFHHCQIAKWSSSFPIPLLAHDLLGHPFFLSWINLSRSSHAVYCKRSPKTFTTHCHLV